MFEVGDLVRFRDKGVVKRGDYDDRIKVRWMPLGKEETMPEFLLEKVTEDT